MDLKTSALIIYEKLGINTDLSTGKEKEPVDLIEIAREITLTFPGMICFGTVFLELNKDKKMEEKDLFLFSSLI